MRIINNIKMYPQKHKKAHYSLMANFKGLI